MTAHPTRTIPRRLTWVASLALAAAALLFGAQPAFAHDALVASDPPADSTVAALPSSITLTLSAAVLDEAGSTIVEVKDAAGTSLTAGAPVIDRNTVTQPLAGQATGAIAVAWRVVSSDGHPVDGSFAFTVNAPATAAPTTAAPTTPAASSEPVASPEPTESAVPISAPAQQEPDVLPWVIGGIIALVAIAAVIALMAARARQGKDTARTRTAGRDDLGER